MKSKNSKKLTVEELTSEEERGTLEAQMKNLADTTRTALALTPDVRIEQVKHPNGPRNLARGKGGKFQRKTRAVTEVSTSMVAEILLSKDEATGKSTHQLMVENLATLCREAKTEKALIGAAKILQQLETSAGITQTRENLLKEEDKGRQSLTIVYSGQEMQMVMQRQMDAMLAYIRSLEKSLGVAADKAYRSPDEPAAPKPTQPNFATEKPQPMFAETLEIRTNPQV